MKLFRGEGLIDVAQTELKEGRGQRRGRTRREGRAHLLQRTLQAVPHIVRVGLRSDEELLSRYSTLDDGFADGLFVGVAWEKG